MAFHYPPHHQKTRGFTLIELMIAVAIIAILTAIAIPSYKSYVVRGNRSAAQSFMMTIAQKQEQYLIDARQYATFTDAAGLSSTLGLGIPREVSSFYTVTCAERVADDPRTFTISAAPVEGTAQADDGTLTLNELGAKSSNWR